MIGNILYVLTLLLWEVVGGWIEQQHEICRDITLGKGCGVSCIT